MNLYQMIYKRRSIRKYKNEEIPKKLLEDILAFATRIQPLSPAVEIKMDMIDNRDKKTPMRGMWKVEAPYYLICYSEDKEGAAVNAGFLLEHILLYMTGKGLGTCYLGGVKIQRGGPDQMKQMIAVAFGYPKTLLYRDPATAKRLPLKELCIFRDEIDENVKNVLKAVRLAPSAMNTQPWRFIVYHDRIYIFSCREFLPSASMTVMREISMGVMLAHLSIAAEEMWMSLKLEEEEAMKKRAYKSGTYVATAFLME